ncbi:hypothetical protein I7I48_01860 [Histoplasma ohiense]|nr:hypothetical protein I7I48_01860 [Histoplasma ohiense (nom. inval.)]
MMRHTMTSKNLFDISGDFLPSHHIHLPDPRLLLKSHFKYLTAYSWKLIRPSSQCSPCTSLRLNGLTLIPDLISQCRKTVAPQTPQKFL